MDFKQIEAYIKVVEFASFSKAAEAIFLSQPSVSTYINSMEKELDTVLLNRSNKDISPTLAGKIFYENAKAIVALRDDTFLRIKSLAGNTSGEINIIASTVPSQYILPKLLPRFNDLYPNISFNIKQADTFEAAQAISGGKSEIGFLGGIVEDGKCEYCEFMIEKLIIIAPINSGFSSLEKYSLKEILYTCRFISRERGSGTRAQYEEFLSLHNININRINICASFDNTQSIINAVINGMGVSIVSEYAARAFIDKKMLCAVKTETKFPERKFYYVLKKNFIHSHLVDLFIQFLTNDRAI